VLCTDLLLLLSARTQPSKLHRKALPLVHKVHFTTHITRAALSTCCPYCTATGDPPEYSHLLESTLVVLSPAAPPVPPQLSLNRALNQEEVSLQSVPLKSFFFLARTASVTCSPCSPLLQPVCASLPYVCAALGVRLCSTSHLWRRTLCKTSCA